MNYPQRPDQQLPAPGWYPDPAQPGLERFWNGGGWTYDTRATGPAAGWPAQAGGYQQGGYPQGAYLAGRPGPRTADGVPLAGWWGRVGASLVDSLVVGLLALLASTPFLSEMAVGLQRWVYDAVRAVELGGQPPDYLDPRYGLTEPYLAMVLISVAVQGIYSVVMQTWRGATLGMLAVGLRVVPDGRGREHHGLALGTATLRWIIYTLTGLLWIVQLISVLLPLANAKRQTLHDIVARTQVVRIR